MKILCVHVNSPVRQPAGCGMLSAHSLHLCVQGDRVTGRWHTPPATGLLGINMDGFNRPLHSSTVIDRHSARMHTSSKKKKTISLPRRQRTMEQGVEAGRRHWR